MGGNGANGGLGGKGASGGFGANGDLGVTGALGAAGVDVGSFFFFSAINLSILVINWRSSLDLT